MHIYIAFGYVYGFAVTPLSFDITLVDSLGVMFGIYFCIYMYYMLEELGS